MALMIWSLRRRQVEAEESGFRVQHQYRGNKLANEFSTLFKSESGLLVSHDLRRPFQANIRQICRSSASVHVSQSQGPHRFVFGTLG